MLFPFFPSPKPVELYLLSKVQIKRYFLLCFDIHFIDSEVSSASKGAFVWLMTQIVSVLQSKVSAACRNEIKVVFVVLGHNSSECSNGSPANLHCCSWLKCTVGMLSFTNNAVFCRSRPRKPWQQTFSEVFGTHWKILWFIPFRQRQPLRVPYHFANHV